MKDHLLDKSEQLRVLITGPSLDAVSGVSTHIRQLLDSRLAAEYELLQFQVGREGRNESRSGRLLRVLRDYGRFVSTLVRYKPHVVHLNPSLNKKAFWRDLVFLLIAKLFRRKVAYQVHGGPTPQRFFRSPPMKRFLKWVLRLPDAIVVLGNVEKEAYEKFSRYKSFAVIPNAIDIAPYEARSKSRTPGRAQLFYIGRLIETKGIAETLDALDILLRDADALPALKFVIAGSGPAEEKLRRHVESASLSDVVTFVGPVFGDRKLDLWQSADIFVFPTYHQEGLPYSILESLASGTPMITSRTGNIPDAIRHGSEGLMVETKRPAAVAEALVKLLSEPDLLREMSANCRQTARERFTGDRLARDFGSLYRRLLDSP